MEAAYFQAAIPDPYVIFGVRLLPLSIGRYRLLKRFGCAFVSPTEEGATFEDLILGILICSMRTDEFLELINSTAFDKELKRLRKRIQREVRHDRYFSVTTKYGLFKAYIESHSAVPPFWDESNGEESSGGAHWSHALEITLRELGYTSEEIEEGPLSKALMDYFKHAENKGAIRLMTDEEIAQGEINRKMFESMEKGAACPGSN